MDGRDAEKRVAASVKNRKDLSWKEWGTRLGCYIDILEDILWPELIIIGGGISAKHAKFFKFVRTRARMVPAEFLNEAGIVGAAAVGRAGAPRLTEGGRPLPAGSAPARPGCPCGTLRPTRLSAEAPAHQSLV